MIDIILSVLKENNINEYIVSKTIEESIELYLIKKDLDMNRKKNITQYEVKLFKEFSEGDIRYKGDSRIKIYESMDKHEIEEVIKSASYAASFVKNKIYKLPKGYFGEKKIKESKLLNLSLEDIALKVKNALYKYDNFEKGFINSSEIFVTKIDKRIISSNGTDASYIRCSINGEFITQWIEKQDVEIYNSFNYDELLEEDLALKAKEAIIITGYRARSENAPKNGIYYVILVEDSVKEFFKYYSENALTEMVYQKYSNFNVNDKVQGRKIKGDKLNITLTSIVPFSNEGIELKDRVLIEDGVLKTFYGSYKFADYLGVEPVGDYKAVKIKGGKTSEDDMFEENNLKILRFSDFQMDTLTGDFSGEIRLALLKCGDKFIPLTGGSLSANIKDVQEKLSLSKELQEDGANEMPSQIKLKNVKIAGL